MIDIYLMGKEGISHGTLDHLNKNDMVWVDCINPLKKELKEISLITGINQTDLVECLDVGERPRMFEYEHYSLIVFRAPYRVKNKVMTSPVSIFISKIKNSILTIRLHELEAIDRVKNKVFNKNITVHDHGLSYLIFRLIDENFNEFFVEIEKISENIETIENTVIKNPTKSIMTDIMQAKRTLIYFNKDLVGNREIVAGIEKEYVVHIEKKIIKEFRNIYNDVVQLIDMVSTNRDILTGTMEVYLSSISNNLNAIMKTLTIISAFVLIPTLISGIYGMNFQISSSNMPELTWRYGYFFAIGLMFLSVMVFYMWFKKKGWL